MVLKHTNPTRPRESRDQKQYRASAPYNFVPLPERMVVARKPLDQDSYREGLTGWIDCELETCSSTYVRGMLTEAQFKEFGGARVEELKPEQKAQSAPFFSTTDVDVDGYPEPVIPGSTLRGMIRNLIEIVGYGRIRWVADKPTFTFRAVAAARDDPLQIPYQDVLGRFGSKVQAGYLEKKGDGWFVRPALTPKSKGWPDQQSFLRVRERLIGGKDIPGYLRFNSPDYRPGWYRVSFDAQPRQGKQGTFSEVRRIGSRQDNYQHHGVLVCSGNMLENAREDQKSPRRNHALILPADDHAKLFTISPERVREYLDGLTPFQREKLQNWGGEQGCLRKDAPVFFVADGDQVLYFGHSPNFRIPARLAVAGENRASRPTDFVPADLRSGQGIDLADAIFGWVEESSQGPKEQPRAGRVFFGNASFVGAENGVWMSSESIIPHILSGPKATTFQHYLVQDKNTGHDPDNKKSLAHYGTAPGKTQIRGHKIYWHKGANPDIEATFREREHENQLTRILPLKAGVRFTFKIHFENLREEELGVLWWVLSLPGEEGAVYRHKLGMGKPLGMGAVALSPKLYLSDRRERYTFLFRGGKWHEATVQADGKPYLEAFETFLLREWGIGPDKSRLSEVERIKMLLTMLQWREGDQDWLNKTRYLQIEYGNEKSNEYKERPVLPDPLAVVQTDNQMLKQRTFPSGESRKFVAPTSKAARATQPVRLQLAAIVEGVVHHTDKRGNVVIELSGMAPDEREARVSSTNLGSKIYKAGDKDLFMITAIKRSAGTTSIECKPHSIISREAPEEPPLDVESYQIGKVKVFERGKGVIEPDDGSPPIFVHRKHLAPGLLNLEAEQTVNFKIVNGMQGLEAREVSLVEKGG